MINLPDLLWCYHRAKVMPASEWICRLQGKGRDLLWKYGRALGLPPAPRLRPDASFDNLPWPHAATVPEPDRAAWTAAGDRVRRHAWRFFQLDDLVETDIDWHRDPVSGLSAPHRFGPDINHRDETLVGNIKITWEKSRHHHLSLAAAAYAVNDDSRYADEIEQQLLGWIDANPFMIGVHWTHPLESAIRLIAWLWCDRLLRGGEVHPRLFGPNGALWPAIGRHQQYISAAYCRGSSANNHLIGEMAGLFCAAAAWPHFDDSPRWCALARASLEREIQRQTFPSSGLNRELADSYHLFTLEFFLLAAAEATRIGQPFTEAYHGALRRMVEAVWLWSDATGHLPPFGDDDEGFALELDPDRSRRTAWLFAAGRALVGAEVPVRAPLPATAQWLGFAAPPCPDPDRPADLGDPEAGRFVLTERRGRPDERYLAIDASPHGFPSLAAHAHADALSFVLHLGGRPVIADPGTYCYHTERTWRNYFRGTRAHNTVEVDGREQSDPIGAFAWRNQAVARVLKYELNTRIREVSAEHGGYERLPEPVTHRRTWHWDLQGITVIDELRGSGRHEAAWRLHLHPDVQARIDGSTVWMDTPSGRLKVTLEGPLVLELSRGADDAGWYSDGLGRKRPCLTIIGRGAFELPARWTARMEWLDEG